MNLHSFFSRTSPSRNAVATSIWCRSKLGCATIAKWQSIEDRWKHDSRGICLVAVYPVNLKKPCRNSWIFRFSNCVTRRGWRILDFEHPFTGQDICTFSLWNHCQSPVLLMSIQLWSDAGSQNAVFSRFEASLYVAEMSDASNAWLGCRHICFLPRSRRFSNTFKLTWSRTRCIIPAFVMVMFCWNTWACVKGIWQSSSIVLALYPCIQFCVINLTLCTTLFSVALQPTVLLPFVLV